MSQIIELSMMDRCITATEFYLKWLKKEQSEIENPAIAEGFQVIVDQYEIDLKAWRVALASLREGLSV